MINSNKETKKKSIEKDKEKTIGNLIINYVSMIIWLRR
jgi:hypothetical protein